MTKINFYLSVTFVKYIKFTTWKSVDHNVSRMLQIG